MNTPSTCGKLENIVVQRLVLDFDGKPRGMKCLVCAITNNTRVNEVLVQMVDEPYIGVLRSRTGYVWKRLARAKPLRRLRKMGRACTRNMYRIVETRKKCGIWLQRIQFLFEIKPLTRLDCTSPRKVCIFIINRQQTPMSS